MNTPQDHRRLRELLGPYALGGLPEDAAAELRAHLDGCADCSAQLAQIAPLADALRDIDAETLAEPPAPSPDLGSRIRQRVAEERALVEARAHHQHRQEARRQRVHRMVAAVAALVVLAAAAGVGVAVGRSTAPAVVATPSPSQPVIPVEQVPLVSAAGLQADTAAVIAHSWGVEARFEGTGFVAGQVYRAAFQSTNGRLLPAGEFVGTGDNTLKCNMQSALLREDATAFVVMDTNGRKVLRAELPS